MRFGKDCVGIAIGKDRIVGVKARKQEGRFEVAELYEMKRKGPIKEDLEALDKAFSLKGLRTSVVRDTEVYNVFLDLPKMTRMEVKDMLHWQIEEYIPWTPNTYYYDFMLHEHHEDNQRMYVLVIAVPFTSVNELASNLRSKEAALEIIDYWPAPAGNLYDEEDDKDYMMLLIKETGCMLYHWYAGMMVYKKALSTTEPYEILDALKESNDEVREKYHFSAKEVAILSYHQPLTGEGWDLVKSIYPFKECRAFPLEETIPTYVNKKDPLSLIALGMAYRGVHHGLVI